MKQLYLNIQGIYLTLECLKQKNFSDISPVILAAHLNRFEILAMLLRKDATIEKPHKHSCSCETCDQERLNGKNL